MDSERHHNQNDGVEVVLAKGNGVPHIGEVVGGKGGVGDKGHIEGGLGQRGTDQPHQRRKPDQPQQYGQHGQRA